MLRKLALSSVLSIVIAFTSMPAIAAPVVPPVPAIDNPTVMLVGRRKIRKRHARSRHLGRKDIRHLRAQWQHLGRRSVHHQRAGRRHDHHRPIVRHRDSRLFSGRSASKHFRIVALEPNLIDRKPGVPPAILLFPDEPSHDLSTYEMEQILREQRPREIQVVRPAGEGSRAGTIDQHGNSGWLTLPASEGEILKERLAVEPQDPPADQPVTRGYLEQVASAETGAGDPVEEPAHVETMGANLVMPSVSSGEEELPANAEEIPGEEEPASTAAFEEMLAVVDGGVAAEGELGPVEREQDPVPVALQQARLLAAVEEEPLAAEARIKDEQDLIPLAVQQAEILTARATTPLPRARPAVPTPDNEIGTDPLVMYDE